MGAITIRPGFVASSRAISALFLLGTALFGIVAYSPFGAEVIVKPHAIEWLAWCTTYYDALSLAVVSLTVISLTVDIPDTRMRPLLFPFMSAAALLVGFLFVRHVLDSLAGTTGLIVAAVALGAAVWLAIIDHASCWRLVFGGDEPSAEESTIFAAAVATTVYVALVFCAAALASPVRPDGSVFSWPALGRSVLLHALAFGVVAWMFSAIVRFARTTRRPRVVEYGLGALAIGAAATEAMRRVALPALELTGIDGALLAAAFGVTCAAIWSGIALRLAAADRPPASGLDVLARPCAPWRSRVALAGWLVVLAAAVVSSGRAVGPDGLPRTMEIATVLGTWTIVWCATLRGAAGIVRTSSRTVVGGSLALLAVVPISVIAGHGSTGVERRRRFERFDRYASADASFRLLDDVAEGRTIVSTSFQRFERTHSNIVQPIQPVSIDFTPRLVPSGHPPNIYVFVIDSLRPDYLSAYNPAVTFTPAIGALARDSLVFRNAFSRYGGTGLAIPSIWAGSMVPHKAYVTPFGPMNALKKLLDANGYRIMTSFDQILTQLLPRTPQMIELGGENWTARDDACRVLGDLRTARRDANAPVFAYSLPQNVHLSYVQGHPILDQQYPGFYSPLAARVHQVDRCLGGFIDDLKADGSYDDSIVVVTADHADAIGEEGRWGHGFALFPEVLRIPLIVHVPSRLMTGWTADLDAVSFSTDIVPTLYRLLGNDVTLRGPIFGMPLVYRRGSAPDVDRRRGAFLVAASYGPVYGILQRNGLSLYVADAVNTREYAYEMPPGSAPVHVRATGGERAEDQRLIRDQIDRIAAFFHFDPPQ